MQDTTSGYFSRQAAWAMLVIRQQSVVLDADRPSSPPGIEALSPH
jgi:hypothetical protein